MKFKITQPFGDGVIELEDDLKDEKGIFKFGEFVNTIPRKHPTGATDLRFSHRTGKTAKGIACNFYEIVCDSAGERYCYHQRTDEKGGGLYKPDNKWEPVYRGEGDADYQDDNRRSETYQQPAQQRQGERRPSQPGKGGDVVTQIKTEFQRLGVNNLGQEKAMVMKGLNLRVGTVVQELAETEKADLLDWLQRQNPS